MFSQHVVADVAVTLLQTSCFLIVLLCCSSLAIIKSNRLKHADGGRQSFIRVHLSESGEEVKAEKISRFSSGRFDFS